MREICCTIFRKTCYLEKVQLILKYNQAITKFLVVHENCRNKEYINEDQDASEEWGFEEVEEYVNR